MSDPDTMPRVSDAPRVGAPRPGAPPRHFAFVDALRGLAILAVIFFHTGQVVSGSFPLLQYIVSFGGCGVQLFFVISAFTLFWSMQNRRSVDRRPLAAFFLRRVFRVAPLFWVGVLFYLAYPDFFQDMFAPGGVDFRQITATICFVHGWYPTSINSVVPGGWSIGAEMMFYLTLPLLFRWVRTFNTAFILAATSSLVVALTTGVAVRILAAHFPPQWFALVTMFVGFSFPAQFPCFCWGIVLYFAVTDPRPGLGLRAGWILLCVIGLGVIGPAYLSFAAGFVLLAWVLTAYPVVVIVNRFTRYVGVVSYSAYLWHFALLDGFAPWLLTTVHITSALPHVAATLRLLLLYSGLVAITLVVASLSYFLIERPFINLGRWVIKASVD